MVGELTLNSTDLTLNIKLDWFNPQHKNIYGISDSRVTLAVITCDVRVARWIGIRNLCGTRPLLLLLSWLTSDIFLTRGSKCTNHRKDSFNCMFPKRSSEFAVFFILCSFSFPYFVIGRFCYVEWIIQWGTIWISFDPKFFEAAVRNCLDNIWPRRFEERVNIMFHHGIPGKTYKCTHCSR